MVLRRSLGMELQPQMRLNQRLESVWGKLCRALSENEAKLNITDAFHTTVEKVCRFCKVCFPSIVENKGIQIYDTGQYSRNKQVLEF